MEGRCLPHVVSACRSRQLTGGSLYTQGIFAMLKKGQSLPRGDCSADKIFNVTLQSEFAVTKGVFGAAPASDMGMTKSCSVGTLWCFPSRKSAWCNICFVSMTIYPCLHCMFQGARLIEAHNFPVDLQNMACIQCCMLTLMFTCKPRCATQSHNESCWALL